MEGKRFASVWDAIEDTPQAAASMKARSSLMMELSSYIEKHGLTQAQAADLLGVSQPRVSDLMRGKINLFSLDMLLNMAACVLLYFLPIKWSRMSRPNNTIGFVCLT